MESVVQRIKKSLGLIKRRHVHRCAKKSTRLPRKSRSRLALCLRKGSKKGSKTVSRKKALACLKKSIRLAKSRGRVSRCVRKHSKKASRKVRKSRKASRRSRKASRKASPRK